MKKNNQKSALLIMDIQSPTLQMLKQDSSFLPSIKKAIQTARSKNILVIYVVIGFRKGYPEMNTNNRSSTRIKSTGMNLDTEENKTVHESVAPQEDDIIITKKRVSAFSGSDLEMILRAQDIQHIVLTGIATSGVVLSTLREAADKDFSITVLADCCADMDEEVHRVLTTKIFPKQADVLNVNDWCSE